MGNDVSIKTLTTSTPISLVHFASCNTDLKTCMCHSFTVSFNWFQALIKLSLLYAELFLQEAC